MLEKEFSTINKDAGFNEESSANLNGIAQWAYYSAIVSFISLAVSIISMVKTMSQLESTEAAGNMVGTLIMGGITLLLNITLITAANNLKKGLAGADQGTLNYGLQKLGSYFLIMGILAIIVLAIFFLALLIGIMSAGMR